MRKLHFTDDGNGNGGILRLSGYDLAIAILRCFSHRHVLESSINRLIGSAAQPQSEQGIWRFERGFLAPRAEMPLCLANGEKIAREDEPSTADFDWIVLVSQ